MKIGFGVLAVSLTTLLATVACAPVNLLNGITPSGSFEKAKDISYGDLERQKLDVYRAETPRPNAPVLVFIHGGSWTDGSKYPEAVYPQMIEDSAKDNSVEGRALYYNFS